MIAEQGVLCVAAWGALLICRDSTACTWTSQSMRALTAAEVPLPSRSARAARLGSGSARMLSPLSGSGDPAAAGHVSAYTAPKPCSCQVPRSQSHAVGLRCFLCHPIVIDCTVNNVGTLTLL